MGLDTDGFVISRSPVQARRVAPQLINHLERGGGRTDSVEVIANSLLEVAEQVRPC